MAAFFRHRHRKTVRQQPLPAAWWAILADHVAYYRILSPEDQAELHGHMHVFLEEKHFEGCNDLEVTERMRVVVAALACVLLLHRETDYFPGLESILLYPQAFMTMGHRRGPMGLVHESDEVRAGESWSRGAVVLSWPDIRRDMRDFDGRNVVFHEFAHQLDQADGQADGWPDDLDDALEPDWNRVMAREFAALVDAVENYQHTFLDAYAAKSPAEFFAVLTENFFERPRALDQHHPELYDILSRYYRQDPRTRFA